VSGAAALRPKRFAAASGLRPVTESRSGRASQRFLISRAAWNEAALFPVHRSRHHLRVVPVILWIVPAGLAMAAIAPVGSATLVLSEAMLKRLLLPLVALAAGSLLGRALFHLLPKAVEQLGNDSTSGWRSSHGPADSWMTVIRRPEGAYVRRPPTSRALS
jgi:hypothetical protein